MGGGVKVDAHKAAQSFGQYFNDKIKSNVAKSKIERERLYNGKNKLIVQIRNFMTVKEIKKCMSDLNNKKCEGFDRIPVCTLYDARASLLDPMSPS